MLAWDNLQETDWFVGILEAEGSASKTKYNNGGQMIRIGNTDLSLIETCQNYLNKLLIKFNVSKSVLKSGKPFYTLRICGRDNCRLLIEHMDVYNSFQCRRQEFLEKLDYLNQLGSSTTTRETTLTPSLYWLIGLFEGEGSIGLYSGKNKDRYDPWIQLANTNQLIIEKYIKTLHNNQLSWYVAEKKSTIGRDFYTRKASTNITIYGMLRCKRFLTVTQGLWRTDKYIYRSNELLKFIDLRLAALKDSPNTDEQTQIYYNLRTN